MGNHAVLSHWNDGVLRPAGWDWKTGELTCGDFGWFFMIDRDFTTISQWNWALSKRENTRIWRKNTVGIFQKKQLAFSKGRSWIVHWHFQKKISVGIMGHSPWTQPRLTSKYGWHMWWSGPISGPFPYGNCHTSNYFFHKHNMIYHGTHS